MNWRKTSPSTYRKVFGLPTWRGLLMVAITALSVWYSYKYGSEANRWCSQLMTLITLIHLVDSSSSIRHLKVKLRLDTAVFAEEETKIAVEVTNESAQATQPLYIAFRGHPTVANPPLSSGSTVVLWIPLRFSSAGLQPLPRLSFRTYSPSKFFRYWRVFDESGTLAVLPRGKDHQLPRGASDSSHDDFETKELEPIRDPRLLPLADQKILQKTGLPYRRIFATSVGGEVATGGSVSKVALDGRWPEKPSRVFNPAAGFAALLISVVTLRESSGLAAQVVMAVAVIFFWYANNIGFGGVRLRNLILILSLALSGFFVVSYFVADVKNIATTGLNLDGEMSPGSISELKHSDDVAVIVDFDHWPAAKERYFKVQTLPHTDNGLHYFSNYALNKNPATKTRLALQPLLYPRTATWVRKNLQNRSLNEALLTIERHFRQGYTYSTEPGRLTSAFPLDEFFFATQSGFCEHYAAAVSTLLSQAGFHSRVVSGYAEGRWNPFLGKLIFAQSDAHAWVEVFDEDLKTWKLVDPTSWIAMAPGPQVVDRSTMVWGLGLIFVILFVLAAGRLLLWARSRKKRPPLQLLLQKLAHLEKNYRYDGQGFTVAERINRLMRHHPEVQPAMMQSLAAYQFCYFRGGEDGDGDGDGDEHEDEARIARLRASLSRWP
ncbi:MAG: hypothetical protein C5B49_06755 [Bdellovibrio sp.]|nr:MAG: hypothetical protein C5B49_06755 [Bdellovibrio sp.]